ncbi:MAG: glycosyltransferase [Planctomycetes bacterium]|nr:glycosyltransferase [Planctomycetota bacterium]NUQ35748.1 glycosyltransferase family 2 protein [Planctomycetaceae bacterium]
MGCELSIYISVYNSAEFLERAFAALRTFDESAVEIVFTDDASTDGSLALLENFRAARKNVKILKHETNRGPGAAANTALAEISGTWFQRCDSDDEILADGVLAALEKGKRTNAKIVFTPFLDRQPDGAESPSVLALQQEALNPLKLFWRFKDFGANLCSMLTRTEHLRACNARFPETRPFVGVDTPFLAELVAGLKYAEVACSEIPSYRYYRRTGSFSAPRLNQQRDFEQRAHALLNNFHELERLGENFVERALLTPEERDAGLRRRAGSTLRALRKAGMHVEMMREYRKIRGRYGTDPRLRRQYIKSLPFWLVSPLRRRAKTKT